MRTAIFSPHTDDAIFSLGDLMTTMDDVTIISVFAGIPDDPAGHQKHKTLRNEHTLAAAVYGAKIVNSDFLDDVYARPDEEAVVLWISEQFAQPFDQVFIPLGIHHPDHIWLHNIFVEYFHYDFLYKELPYGVLFPELVEEIAKKENRHIYAEPRMITPQKTKAIEKYVSQLKNNHIRNEILVKETIYA